MVKKAFIITGPECSGSVFISQVIANCLGATKNINDWNGFGRCKSIVPNIEVLHRSQPSGPFKYTTLKEFKNEYRGAKLYFILTTRYHEFSNLSKIRRFKRCKQDIEFNMAHSKLILSEIIKSKEKYFIWNYETMLYLNENYFDILYDFLEVSKRNYPKIKDGNIKYFK